jgi:hypothetical protein
MLWDFLTVPAAVRRALTTRSGVASRRNGPGHVVRPRMSRRTLLLLGLVSASCGRDRPQAGSAASEPVAIAAANPAPAPAPSADQPITGTVLETMNAGGYTYAKIDRGGGATAWTAGPATPLAVGARVAGLTGTMMTAFRSESLQRTFPEIYFVTSFGAAAPSANPHGAAVEPATQALASETIAPIRPGKTVAEVFAGKATLAGKTVAVRGKVVKLNTNILGRNWIHLQDGTGGVGTNDLLVTTDATAKVGDIVVVRGRLALDKDFGSGYRYDVLVESATVAAK